ncbi:MAG: hypothetical protein ACI9BW_000194 [Gammaproteobacteria bacterium]|jgi:hypothetical protein
MRTPLLVGITVLSVMSQLVIAAEPKPTLDEVWKIVQQQQAIIESLQQQLAATQGNLKSAEQNIEETKAGQSVLDQKIEATADAVESSRGGVSSANTTSAGGSINMPASERYRGGVSWANTTSVGGYGELHYNDLDDNSTSASGDGAADDRNRVDFHRFVFYLAHEFTDSIRFFSEVEIEHSVAGDGQPGEVELEQAWIEMDITSKHRFRAGLNILPVGLINVTHEPNTFYGVERNRVESEIIPTTWWEAAAGLNGEIAQGWNYDMLIHSGLKIPTSGSSAFRPRSGRTKIAEADDTDYALTGRIRYTGMPGLEVSLSGQYQADYTGTADAFDVDAFLVQAHVDWKHSSGFGLRAFYASWFFDDMPTADLNADAFDAEDLDGFYIEPAYRFASPFMLPGEFGVFARYAEWDERNNLGSARHRFDRYDQIAIGINYWPTPQVVFKIDGQWEDADKPVDRTLDGFNLGLGYQF